MLVCRHLFPFHCQALYAEGVKLREARIKDSETRRLQQEEKRQQEEISAGLSVLQSAMLAFAAQKNR